MAFCHCNRCESVIKWWCLGMAGLVRWKDALFLRVSRLRFDILPTEWYVRITLFLWVSRLIPVRLPASFRVRWLDFTAVPW